MGGGCLTGCIGMPSEYPVHSSEGPSRARRVSTRRRPRLVAAVGDCPGGPQSEHRAWRRCRTGTLVSMSEPLHRALGLTDGERDEVEAILAPLPEPPRARPLRRHVERALLLQVVADPPAAAAHRGPPRAGGPGRERRGHRRRRRYRRGHPHREPQPPLGHRALPGGGHRRRRHPAGHLHHGGPAHRRHGPAVLRRPEPGPPAVADRGRGGRHLRLRELGRGADGRGRAHLQRLLRPEPAGERAVHGRPADRPAGARCGHRGGEPGRAARLLDRPGRDRRGQRAGLGGVRRRATPAASRRGQATQRAGRRPLRGEAADRGVPRAPRRQAGGRDPGPRRGRPGVRHQRDGGPGWRGDGRRRLGRAPARARHGGLRGDDVGEPGADAGHRHPRATWPGSRRCAAVGRSARRWWAG